jgi:SAM-dependent methyltransferase
VTDEPRQWRDRADELAAEAVAAGEPTAWFDRLYVEGVDGSTTLAWDRAEPNPLLVRAFEQQPDLRDGRAKRAVVVGAGLGADAAYVAQLGYQTTGFDVSPTAMRIAAERIPEVEFVAADLFRLPSEWRQAFDLVVEIYTVQALPRSVRDRATAAVRDLVAPAGTLVVIQSALGDGDDADDGPPWPLTRGEMDAFAGDGLEPVSIDAVPRDSGPFATIWLATIRRSPTAD